MKQSTFDIIITATDRSRVISFLKEFLDSNDIEMSDIYSGMIMSVVYGEFNSMAVLNRNQEKVDSLFALEDETGCFYRITINHPQLKRLRFLNIEFDLLAPAEFDYARAQDIFQTIENCRLFLYVFPITADWNQERSNIQKLSSNCQNGTPCLVIFTGLQQQPALPQTGFFSEIHRYTKAIGLNASLFIFTPNGVVSEELKYHFRHGKDELWQMLAEYSNIQNSFIFRKQNEDLINILQSTIHTVTKLISKYHFSESITRQIQESIYIINRKCNDSNFYLGVVGEFSSGKSTLINAILREDLLTTSPTQSTTCAATYISHSNQTGIKIKMNDGVVKSFWVKRKEEMKQLYEILDDFAANENIASQVETVDLTFPFTGQGNGFTIIDTPGVNVSNERHLELTTRIIKKECDALVVVISAMEPMSHSLENFIRDNLDSENQKCIFAVTKLDLCGAPEKMCRVLQDINNKLRNDLNVSHPVIVQMASIVIMDELYKAEGRYQRNLEPGFRANLYQKFIEGEALIIKTLRQNKMKFQYVKVYQVIQLIYEILSGELKAVADGLHQDFKMLFSGDPNTADDNQAFTLLKKQQSVNQDLKLLFECKKRLDLFSIPD